MTNISPQMDMTAEFYLSTVERIFKNREIARNDFTVGGVKVDLGAISKVAVMTVEGEKDDISPRPMRRGARSLEEPRARKKNHHLEPEAGHYGIFAGKSWRLNIRPLVLGFIDATPTPTTSSSRSASRPEAQLSGFDRLFDESEAIGVENR